MVKPCAWCGEPAHGVHCRRCANGLAQMAQEQAERDPGGAEQARRNHDESVRRLTGPRARR